MRRALPWLLLLGCNYQNIVAPIQDGVGTADGSTPNVRLTKMDMVDVLVVLDSSPSMAGKEVRTDASKPPAILGRLRDFVLGLRQASGISLHFGVVTSDLGAGALASEGCHPDGDRGALRPVAGTPDCTPGSDTWLALDSAGPGNAPGGDAAGAIDCMLNVGTAGCGFEQPLEAALRALSSTSDHGPDGELFLRSDALLVVVFVTDEDDCSAPASSRLFDASADLGPLTSFRCTRAGVTVRDPPQDLPAAPSGGPLPMPAPRANPTDLFPVSRYTDLFARPRQTIATDVGTASVGIKDDPADVLLLAIAGPREPFELIGTAPGIEPATMQPGCTIDGNSCVLGLRHSCVASSDSRLFGDPATRLLAVATAPAHGYSSSICAPDHQAELADLATYVQHQRQPQDCVQVPLADTNNPNCTVEDVPVGGGTPHVIPWCGRTGDTAPCWKLPTNTKCPPQEQHLTGAVQQFQIVIMRGAATPADVVPRARCSAD